MPSELVLVIGACGAGKTTWARANLPNHAHPDAEQLARTLFADPSQSRYYPWVRVVMKRLVHCATVTLLERGVSVAVAGRGATPDERRTWIDLAASYGAPTHIVWLATPPEVCVARAQADPNRPRTSRRAWPQIVANWYRDWQPPTPDEGYASYRVIPHEPHEDT